MRIGIDARLLSEQITGIGRYTSEIVSELTKLPCECLFYSPRPIVSPIIESNNIKYRSMNIKSRLGRMLWSQTVLPYWAVKDQVDIFWGPNHRLPQFLPKNIAKVVTIHDLVWKHAGDTMRPMSRFIEKFLMPQAVKRADYIVADSTNTKKDIEAEYSVCSEKIKVIYPGASDFPVPGTFDSLRYLGVTESYFLFVGTLEPRKNLYGLLEAFASLTCEVRSKARLVIVGGKGWGGVNIPSVIDGLGLHRDALVMGYVNDQQLSTLYANARFLVMPSLYEGFGLPLVEAMSFGVPVLTSNVSSLPEVAGKAGLLVDPLDKNSIANGLAQLIGDEKLHALLSSQTKESARRFDWSEAAQQLLEVCRKSVKSKNKKTESALG